MDSDFKRMEQLLDKATDELYALVNELKENGLSEFAKKAENINDEYVGVAWRIAFNNS